MNKRNLDLVCNVFSVAALLAVLMWLALSSSGIDLVVGIFGFISVLVLAYTSDSMSRYASLVIPEMFFNPFIWLFIFSLNIIILVGGLFLFICVYKDYDIVLVLQTPFLVFAAMVVMPTLLWCIGVSKLTPKPGTMVVDEDDLCYLPGDELPRLSREAQIITPQTKILVSVMRYYSSVCLKHSRSFCFAPWVFMQEARLKLPGSIYYSNIIKSAETEFRAEYPDVKSIQDIWRPFYFPPTKKGNSPYVWNHDATVSE